MDHFTEPMKLFQKDELSSVDVVQGLRKYLVTFAEYIYNLERIILKTPVYDQVEQILLLEEKKPTYIPTERTYKQFEEYFLKENWSFRDQISKNKMKNLNENSLKWPINL